MQKLNATLAALTSRNLLLTGKREAAQAAFDRAVDARQHFMLEGDLSDEKNATKLQAAVDTAASVLDGFTAPLTALATSISLTKQDLEIERQSVNRKAASDTLTAQVRTIEETFGPWLKATRDLAAAATEVSSVSFETGQVGAFLRNAASEVETALSLSIKNLHDVIAAILIGHIAIPSAPEVYVPPAWAEQPAQRQVFLLHAITWLDHRGQQRCLGKWNDSELPEKAAAFALRAGIAVPLDDPRCAKLRGHSAGHPEPGWCNDLDAETGPDVAKPAEANEEPTTSIVPRDRNTPYIIKREAAPS